MPMQISISNAIRGGSQGSGGGSSFESTNSFAFNGSSDYIESVSTYTELDSQTKATFSFWVKPSLNQFGILFHVPRNTTVAQGQVLCFLDTNYRVRWSMDTTSYYGNSLVNAITLDVWNHILICIDLTQSASQDKNRVFINGVNQTAVSTLGTRTAFSTSTDSLIIGEEKLGYLTPFLGKMDEFAIWSGTDLRNDISTIYNCGVPNNLNDNGLTAPTTWFRMGESANWDGSNWTLTDQGSGGNNATSQNMIEASRVNDVPPTFNIFSTTFDGIDDYVDCGDNDNLSFGDGTTDSPFSISIWLNIGNTSTRGVVSKYGSIGLEWLFYMVAGKVRFLLNDTINSSNIFATGSTALTLNTWYHVAITYDGSGLSGINIYVNGVLETLTTGGSGYVAMSNTNQPLEIGKYSTLEFLGKADEVAIFNSELSASDITTIYNGGVPNDITSLSPLSWWRMGDCSIYPTINDLGSGGNDGTMTFMSSANFVTDVPT